MGIDVPDGSAPPEHPKETAPSKPSSEHKNKNLKGPLAAVSCLLLLVTAALLIGFLPNWGKEDGTPEPDDPEEETLKFYESTMGPFDVKLPLFSSKLIGNYLSTEDLEDDIGQVARFLLNEAITSNAAYARRDPIMGGETDAAFEDQNAVSAPVADGTAETIESTTGDADLGTANDFETNNQEDNVDRADLAKADEQGIFLFLAYGDRLVIVHADSGEEVSRVQIPSIALPEGFGSGSGEGGVGDEDASGIGNGDEGGDGTGGGSAGSSSGSDTMEDEPIAVDSAFWMPYDWDPKPRIDALLVEGNRVAVVASGYGIELTAAADAPPPILWDQQNTKIHLYAFDDEGIVTYVSSQSMNGSFRDAFSMEDNGYLVTQAGINTWDYLLLPVQRWQERFAGLDDDQYLELATLVAEDEVIPAFILALQEALFENGHIKITPISLYADSVSADGDAEVSLFEGGVVNAITHVVAFDMMSGTIGAEAELSVDISATFQPGHWGHVYAHEKMIIVADQGWSWNEEDQSSGQMTYLLGFRLDGPTSFQTAVGSVAGHIMSPYSLDFVEVGEDSYLRVATTQNFWWGGGGFIEVLVDEAEDISESNTASEPPVEEEESSTLNQILVLKLPTADGGDGADGEMTLVGQVEMGKPNESFTTVRFFELVAYAVTYERIDPFYVVDLSDPENPTVTGELEVLGFSEYLHPINSSNDILAAVGQLADENGRIMGLQISLFNAQDPLNPTLLDRLPLTEEGTNSWSHTPVSWEPRAFRFLRFDEGVGYLIMPITTYTYSTPEDELVEIGEVKPEEPEYFEGFVAFSINVNLPEGERIQRVLEIDHTDSTSFEYGFYYCSWLPERSFVINGHLITLKSHSLVSTSLVDPSEPAWTLEMDAELGGCPMWR